MPAGVPLPTYIKFMASAMFSMFLGSQCVHVIFKPMEGLEEEIEKERRSLEREVERLKQILKVQQQTMGDDGEKTIENSR